MLNRRHFIARATATAALATVPGSLLGAGSSPETKPASGFEYTLTRDWLVRWHTHILKDARSRYCDSEMGETIGWFMAPYLEGFYYGYKATHDILWVNMIVDWADSWIKRGIQEPDGFIGWPRKGTGGVLEDDFYTDSLLGEATALRPLTMMAGEIRSVASLETKFGSKAEAWLKLAEQTFSKWVARGCWREVKEGGLWVVPAFGIDQKTGQWTEGYARRNSDGFSHPANKQNYIALSLLALHDVTKKFEYKERAEKWWRLMKARIRTQEEGKFLVWNYWDPAGPWDFLPNGEARHWSGVHPSGGYYEMDAEGMVAAFEHGIVFTAEDIRRLIATNRDFMWNQEAKGAKFQRIDGRLNQAGQKDWSGTLWPALIPYDESLRKVFVINHDPASWSGLNLTPWFRARLLAGFPGAPT